MLDVRLLINKWWDSKREIGFFFKCIWYKVIMWLIYLFRIWIYFMFVWGVFVGLINLIFKKKKRNWKKRYLEKDCYKNLKNWY